MSVRSSITANISRVMRHLVTVGILCFGVFASELALAQNLTVLPQGGAGQPRPATCVILKRVGAVDKVTARVMTLGIHGKQFQYIEGKLPVGVTFHDKLTERDVNALQAQGVEVVIVSSDVMPDELQQAGEYCRMEARKAAVQPNTADIEISSTPLGSDIELDGKFIGSTPSSVRLPAGEHTVKISKNGYAIWERTITTVVGTVRIAPDLQPEAPSPSSTAQTSSNLVSKARQSLLIGQ